jgi:hypothetical protein
MAYTKLVAKSDKITIDGTDVSNSFRNFSYTSEHSEVDVSGFSAAGTDETLPGNTAQTFVGEAFYTEELALIVEPLGLVDATREIYTGTCTINQFGPSNTRGEVSVMPFNAKPATSAGITVSDWT